MRNPPIWSFTGNADGFEFDAVFPGDFWPYVDRRSLLFVGMAELENDLRIADRETIHVANTPP
jgi:hypothetical protein